MTALAFAGLAAEVAATVALVAADDDGAPIFLLALGPAAGGALYFGLFRFYRNTHESHRFEHETRVHAQPVTGQDAKVGEVKGTKRRGIEGGNSSDHRQRVQRQ